MTTFRTTRDVAAPVDLTIELAPSPSGTRVSWSQAFTNAEAGRRLEKIVVPANEQNLDRWTAEVLGAT